MSSLATDTLLLYSLAVFGGLYVAGEQVWLARLLQRLESAAPLMACVSGYVGGWTGNALPLGGT